jgi:hypothetical protein
MATECAELAAQQWRTAATTTSRRVAASAITRSVRVPAPPVAANASTANVPAFGAGFGLRLRLTGRQDRRLLAVASIGLVLTAVDAEAQGLGRLLLVPPFLPAAAGYAGVGNNPQWTGRWTLTDD